jgi:hypothetical protein
MNEIIQTLFSTSLIDEGVNEAVGMSIRLGAVLAPLFFLGNVAWNFGVTTLKNFGQRPTILFDRMELVRASILWFMLTIGYQPIFGTFAHLGEALGRYSMSKSAAVANGKNKLADNYSNQLQKETDAAKQGEQPPTKGEQPLPQQPPADDSISLWDVIKGGWNTIILSVYGAAWGLLCVIVRVVVLVFAIILAKIFYAIGPVVIAFSILPVFKDKFGQWAGVYLNCLCVPFTMNLLDTIVFSVIGKAWTGEALASPFSTTIFGICMTVCYALAFWITSFYCGSSGAAKIMSTAVSVATQAATMAMSGGAASAAGASGGSGGGKNIIEDKSKNQEPATN